LIRREILVALLAGVIAIVWTSFYFDRGLDPFDVGIYATEAWRILEGQSYGTDFLAPYGPGRYYLIALLFALFGTSLKVQAFLFLALRGVVAFLMIVVSRRVLRWKWAFLVTAAVIVAPGALHKSLFQTVVLFNLAAWFLYRRKPGLGTCFLAGLLAGGGALFRVDAGVFGAVSFVTLLALELVWDRPQRTLPVFSRRLSLFSLGAALPVAPVAALLAFSGDLVPVLEAELQRTANVIHLASTVRVPGLFEAFSSGSMKKILLSVLVPAAPAALLLLGLIVLFSRLRGDRKKGALEFLAMTVYGLPVLNQLRITPTFNHLLQAVPIALIAATLVLVRLGEGLGGLEKTGHGKACPGGRPVRNSLMRGVGYLAVLPALSLMVFNLCYTRADSVLPGSIRNRTVFSVPIPLERAGLCEREGTAADLKKIVAAVEERTDPGDTIFVDPFCPVLHVLAGRLPAGPFLEPFYYFGNGSMQKRMVDEMAGNAPVLVVLGGPVRSVGGRSLAKDAPLLRAYIFSAYRPTINVGTYQIWERKR
jgi:hypothetical protein